MQPGGVESQESSAVCRAAWQLVTQPRGVKIASQTSSVHMITGTLTSQQNIEAQMPSFPLPSFLAGHSLEGFRFGMVSSPVSVAVPGPAFVTPGMLRPARAPGCLLQSLPAPPTKVGIFESQLIQFRRFDVLA